MAGTGSCSVSPDPVGQQQLYTVTLTGGPADTSVVAWTTYSDRQKDEIGFVTDANGDGSGGMIAFSVPGTAKVKVVKNQGGAAIASCEFSVSP